MKKLTKFEKISIVIWVFFAALFILIYSQIVENKKSDEFKHCFVLEQIANFNKGDFNIETCMKFSDNN